MGHRPVSHHCSHLLVWLRYRKLLDPSNPDPELPTNLKCQQINYTFGHLVPALVMVESPQALLFEHVALDETDADAALTKTAEPELLLALRLVQVHHALKLHPVFVPACAPDGVLRFVRQRWVPRPVGHVACVCLVSVGEEAVEVFGEEGSDGH